MQFAQALGYLIGMGSFLLYTPIAIRLLKQGSADGLTLSTWWLKLASYVCQDIYFLTHAYDISTYVETIVITVQAAVILLLAAYYQGDMRTATFWMACACFVLTSYWMLALAPADVVAVAQLLSTGLNTGALLPQCALNHRLQSSGDYSPVTATLATVGSAIRAYTIIVLADADVLLVFSNSLACIFNACLLAQIVYMGTRVEGKSLLQVFTADVVPTTQVIEMPTLEVLEPIADAAEGGTMAWRKSHAQTQGDSSDQASSIPILA